MVVKGERGFSKDDFHNSAPFVVLNEYMEMSLSVTIIAPFHKTGEFQEYALMTTDQRTSPVATETAFKRPPVSDEVVPSRLKETKYTVPSFPTTGDPYTPPHGSTHRVVALRHPRLGERRELRES